jgi:hypothetical protein
MVKGTEHCDGSRSGEVESAASSFREIGSVILDHLRDPRTYIPTTALDIYRVFKAVRKNRQARRWVETERAIIERKDKYGCFLPNKDLGSVEPESDPYEDSSEGLYWKRWEENGHCGICGPDCVMKRKRRRLPGWD